MQDQHLLWNQKLSTAQENHSRDPHPETAHKGKQGFGSKA